MQKKSDKLAKLKFKRGSLRLVLDEEERKTIIELLDGINLDEWDHFYPGQRYWIERLHRRLSGDQNG